MNQTIAGGTNVRNPTYTPDYWNPDVQDDHFYTQDFFNTPHTVASYFNIHGESLDDRGRTNTYEVMPMDGTGYERKRFAFDGAFVSNTKAATNNQAQTIGWCLLGVGIFIIVWSNKSRFLS